MQRYYPARQIVPGLWIGSAGDAANPRAAERRKFGLVVNCSKDIEAELPVPTYRVPVDDWPKDSPVMLRHLPEAVAVIDDTLQRGQSVLVHCYAGIQRSATVVAAYLMWRDGLGAREAMQRVQAVKPETFSPRPTFARALRQWETRLKDANFRPG